MWRLSIAKRAAISHNAALCYSKTKNNKNNKNKTSILKTYFKPTKTRHPF